VEVAFELQELLAAGVSAGEADAVQRRLGAGAGEADALITGNRFAKQLGEIRLQFILVGAGRAACEDLLGRLAHARIAVAQQRRPVATAEVDVLPPVEVPHAATLGAVEEHRMADGAIEACRGGDAAGEIVAGRGGIGRRHGSWDLPLTTECNWTIEMQLARNGLTCNQSFLRSN